MTTEHEISNARNDCRLNINIDFDYEKSSKNATNPKTLKNLKTPKTPKNATIPIINLENDQNKSSTLPDRKNILTDAEKQELPPLEKSQRGFIDSPVNLNELNFSIFQEHPAARNLDGKELCEMFFIMNRLKLENKITSSEEIMNVFRESCDGDFSKIGKAYEMLNLAKQHKLVIPRMSVRTQQNLKNQQNQKNHQIHQNQQNPQNQQNQLIQRNPQNQQIQQNQQIHQNQLIQQNHQIQHTHQIRPIQQNPTPTASTPTLTSIPNQLSVFKGFEPTEFDPYCFECQNKTLIDAFSSNQKLKKSAKLFHCCKTCKHTFCLPCYYKKYPTRMAETSVQNCPFCYFTNPSKNFLIKRKGGVSSTVR